MKLLGILGIALALLFGSSRAAAQETCEGACVAPEDMKVLMELARERQCLDKEKPTFKLDPVNIVVDRQGRVFFSGDDPQPYRLKMEWCHLKVEAEGKVKVVAAVMEPPTAGFRFRPKAYMGMLLAEPFRDDKDPKDAIDAGLMVDPIYFHDFNLNFHAGFRSVGAGVGVDIFRSFGAYAGYALTYDLHHNPMAALWFSFW